MSIYQHFRPEEKDFIDQVLNWKDFVENAYASKLTDFLDPREQHILKIIIGQNANVKCEFFGGVPEAERKRALLVPEYGTSNPEDFQIQLFEIDYPRKFITIEHPQVLGSLMSLGLKRAKFGDILILNKRIQIFIAEEVSEYVRTQVQSIGRATVTLSPIEIEGAIHSNEAWEEESISISSLRLDTVISGIHHVSRQKSQSDAPVYHMPSTEPAYYQEFQAMENTIPQVDNYKEALIQLLSQPTIASKEWVYDQYDYMVRTNTVVSPGSDAAVVRIRGTRKALAMTTDCNSRYVYLDPEMGGKIAVAEAARNIVCSGAEPIAITDNLNFGNPEKPEVFWQIEKSADGMSDACRVLNTPVIGGNVSLYNETSGTAIYPTPVVGMVGLVTDINHITTQNFKNSGELIYLVGETKDEFGGSELQKLLNGQIFGKAPELKIEIEKERQSQVLEAIRAGLVQSAHDLSEGGLAVAIAESLFGANRLGAKIEVEGNLVSALFSETQSRFLISVKKEHQSAFEKIVGATLIGEVNDSSTLQILSKDQSVLEASVEELKDAWKGAIPCLLK